MPVTDTNPRGFSLGEVSISLEIRAEQWDFNSINSRFAQLKKQNIGIVIGLAQWKLVIVKINWYFTIVKWSFAKRDFLVTEWFAWDIDYQLGSLRLTHVANEINWTQSKRDWFTQIIMQDSHSIALGYLKCIVGEGKWSVKLDIFLKRISWWVRKR